MKSKVHYAVAAILSAVSYGALAAQPVSDNSAADTNSTTTTLAAPATSAQSADASNTPQSLNEVVVTATRRSENVQDVPVTVQALTGQMIKQLHISSFEDYVKMLPNLTSADNGPGMNEIYIRGVGAGTISTVISGTTSPWPNVGVYLDDQSVQFPGQNMDIYAADLSRIEVLEGPQGTLFGSGSEAGAIRYITNKPELDAVGGSASADYGTTAHGDPNTAVTGVLNLPLIPEKLAVRFVVYNDRQGGYIDNEPATFVRKDTDLGIYYANYPAVNGHCPDGGVNNGFCAPPGSPSASNSALVQNDFNPVTYNGGRVEALYKFNDDWSLLITQLYQNMDAEGVFYQYPNGVDGEALGPLETETFVPTYHLDKDSNTAWTLNGKAGPISLIYTGGFLSRNIETQTDYTSYARAIYADYYQCYGPGTGGDDKLKSTCFSPVAYVHSAQQNHHWQHEVRAETPSDWRLRGIVGAYEEDNVIYDQTGEDYKTIPACTSNDPAGDPGNSGCLSNLGTFPGSTVVGPQVQSSDTGFLINTKREMRQIAEFASASFDLTSHWTVTGGARHFIFLNSLQGSILSDFGCFEGGDPAGGCESGHDLDAQHLSDTEGGWRAQANVSWHMDPTLFGDKQHILTYFTFSQGFRPGGFNRNGGSLHGPGADGVDQFVVPASYAPDKLTNYEVGWKTDWRLFNRSFQWNTAFYREDWNNAQITFFDPGVVGNINFDMNGQDFRIDGAETSFIAQIWQGLTFRGTAAWNSSEQTNSPELIDNNPESANYGKPITEVCPSSGASCTPVTNPFGPRGAPSSNSPPIHLSFFLRDDFPLDALGGFFRDSVGHVQVGLEHQGHSFTQAGSTPPFYSGAGISTARLDFEDPAYSMVDASIGIGKGQWDLTAYGENLTNSNAAVYTSTDNFIEAQTPLRPRVIGLRFDYNF
jgi:outer membrane receptor protein involved in Fe transport